MQTALQLTFITMQVNEDGYKRIAEILNKQKCETKAYNAVDQ
jgi:hypothetical protein